MKFTTCVLVAALGTLAGCAAQAKPGAGLRIQRFTLSPEPVEQSLLHGPPQTAGMHSGRVVLAPGAHMHKHTTGTHEEVLVFLQGEARVTLGTDAQRLKAGEVLYIPPQTEHELENDGTEELRYLYIVAPVVE